MKTAINYLFPSDQITKLPTWRFILHFVVPPDYTAETLANAIAALKAAEWKIVTFPFGLDALVLDSATKAVGIPIEVPEDRRRRAGSLPDYESDVWKIMGNMVASGFGDLYYEAIDWKEENNVPIANGSSPAPNVPPAQRKSPSSLTGFVRRLLGRGR